MPADEQVKGSPTRGRSAVRSGTFTGLSYVMLALVAAVAGAFLAHKFGRYVRTDGFLAAYGVYLVLVLGAQAFRMVVVPDFTRAEAEGRLGPEFRGYLVSFLAVAVPATALAAAFPDFWGELITGRLPEESAKVAGDALPWLIPAAFAQLPGAALLLSGSRWPRDGGIRLQMGHRLWRLLYGAAVPLAVQGLYVIALRFAAGTGEGNVSSLSYAYLLAGTFVSATAFALVGAAAGLVALVGGRVVTAVLGDAYSGDVGDELGRLVVYLSPWMVANAAFSITYPLIFVMHRTRLLIPLALAAVAVDIPISIEARAWWGLTGVTVALGVSTLLLVFGLMASLAPRMLVLSFVGLGRLSLVVGAATALAFGGAALVLSAVPAAAAGLALYALILVALRQLGLTEAWHYVRALH